MCKSTVFREKCIRPTAAQPPSRKNREKRGGEMRCKGGFSGKKHHHFSEKSVDMQKTGRFSSIRAPETTKSPRRAAVGRLRGQRIRFVRLRRVGVQQGDAGGVIQRLQRARCIHKGAVVIGPVDAVVVDAEEQVVPAVDFPEMGDSIERASRFSNRRTGRENWRRSVEEAQRLAERAALAAGVKQLPLGLVNSRGHVLGVKEARRARRMYSPSRRGF